MGVPVVCFIPCCSEKRGYGSGVNPPYYWPPAEVGGTWAKLEAGRRGMEYCIDRTSRPVPALHLYTGNFYSVPGLKEAAERLIRSGILRLFIISAGYGVLDALEPACKYDAKMEGSVAAHWRNAGLEDVIAEICLNLKPDRVYGFFAGTPFWSVGGAKYRYFFTAGVHRALRSGLAADRAGCFYRQSGMGVGAILQALGKCFHDFAATVFREDYPRLALAGRLNYGRIHVGYEEIRNAGDALPTARQAARYAKSEAGGAEPTLLSSAARPAVYGAETASPESRAGQPPTADDFQVALDSIFEHARGEFIDVKSGDLHRMVGGYPGPSHRMPLCCRVMRQNMRPGDSVINEPPKGAGAGLVIRYMLPR